MKIVKRNKSVEEYDEEKIKAAIWKSFDAVDETIDLQQLQMVLKTINQQAQNLSMITVEAIQDIVEEALMKYGFFSAAKAYILYRDNHARQRNIFDEFTNLVGVEISDSLKAIQKNFDQEIYDFGKLLTKFKAFYKAGMSEDTYVDLLIKACVELISKEETKWEFIAARLWSYKLHENLKIFETKHNINNYYEKINYLTHHNYYGAYLLENYSPEEIAILGAYIKDDRDNLFNYSGLELLVKRYLIKDEHSQVIESVQEMYMGISMHLAMKEADKVKWAKEIYDILSTLQVTMATPTMANARKPYHQLSSCFIDTTADSLEGIYKSIDCFAKVSKYGGGMGLYFGKIRASGSAIRGIGGASGGIIRWIKLVNDTAVAVDQLGVRQGAVAVYLDAWHKDLPEFLSLRTNNGDDRMKAHDIFPAVCYPDLFWKMCKEDLNNTWYLMCPHEIQQIKGYCLEDYYGDEWEKRYFECVEDNRINKREICLKDLVRLILKSAVETGTPFTFNRDIVNEMNPNHHQGMIYCSNLCTEIAQNMSSMEIMQTSIENDDGMVIVEKIKPGDFVVCNLASLVLGNIDVQDEKQLKHIIDVTVRALDNVISLNYYPLPQAKITSEKYRAIGLGCSGYHHLLAKNNLRFESDEHLAFVDKLFEKIAYYAINASMELAKEKGSYVCFKGSDYDTGAYFSKRGYQSEAWQKLAQQVHQNGMRNGYLLAIAPTGSTSIIAGTTAGVDPIMKKFFLEEKKGSMIARVAPDLNSKTYWLYKNAHLIDQKWLIKAASVRQKHIDQSQSINLYITNDYTLRQLLNLYIFAWEQKIKCIYYIRSQSLEVEECESCSA